MGRVENTQSFAFTGLADDGVVSSIALMKMRTLLQRPSSSQLCGALSLETAAGVSVIW